MLRSISEITGYTLEAQDGEIGKAKDFAFDEATWTVRYMVADTGSWLPGRKVLVSPITLGQPEWQSRRFPVRLTKAQIEAAPGLDSDAPVSRQYEREWFDHHGWPYYWGGSGLWGGAAYPASLYVPEGAAEADTASPEDEDTVLRATSEVTGYHIQAVDGDIGHVEDFIVDDVTWVLRYMVVDTRNWLPGRKVLLARTWVGDIDWAERRVAVNVTRRDVQESPRFEPSTPVNRAYEARLYDYYGRPAYWQE